MSLKEKRMLYFFIHSLVLADGITIKIGNNAWTFGSNLIVYLIVAAIVGLVAEFLVGWRLPFGFIGAIVLALVGVWLMTQVIIISGLGDINIGGVPIIRALLGAIILVALWHMLTYRSWHRSRRSYRRYRE